MPEETGVVKACLDVLSTTIRKIDLRWLKMISSTFQDEYFDKSLL